MKATNFSRLLRIRACKIITFVIGLARKLPRLSDRLTPRLWRRSIVGVIILRALSGVVGFFLLLGASSGQFETLMGKGTRHWRYVHQPQDVALLKKAESLYERPHKAGGKEIPRIVHFIWLGPRAFPAASVENVRRWIGEHPGWVFKFWTDRARDAPCKGMETVLIKRYPFERLRWCYESSQNWGEKSDILRYEILFHQGGVYADHDMKCLRSFKNFHEGYDFYCGLEPPHPPFVGLNVTVGNGLIGSSPGHPVLKRVIELVEGHWDELAKKYPGDDGYSKTQIVMERTYMAFTYAVRDQIDRPGFIDTIFPAAYFFAKAGMTPLYSKHFYANTWADFDGKKPPFERDVTKKVIKLEKKYQQLLGATVVSLSSNCILLFFYISYIKKAGRP